VFTSLLLFFFLTPQTVFAQSSMFGRLLGEEAAPGVILSRFGRLMELLDKKEITPTPAPDSTGQVLGFSVNKNLAPPVLTVAMLGDSMIDVLWESLPQLRTALEKYFPNTKLNLYNFGVGASNIEYASYRLANSYEYMGKSFPAVLSIKPDVLVLESFAYNNFGDNQEGLDKQWLLIAEIIEKTKRISPKTKIVLASTIAPNSAVYGDGIDGIDWPLDQKMARAVTVRKYLENMINFATSEGYPLADAYHASMDASGEGKLEYISASDHLHLSGSGGVLFCNKVAEVISSLW